MADKQVVTATRSFDQQIPGIDDLVARAQARIRSGLVAYDALERLKTSRNDAQAAAQLREHAADLGYALLLKRYVADPRTADAATIAMAAGDTCMVYAGTYNETVTISAGAAGNYKTLKVNPGDTVNINGAVSVNSHTKLVGFRISHASSPASGPCVSVAGNATDWFITNNIMQSCGSPMIKESRNFAGTSYGYIQGNTLSYACSTPASPNTCTGMLINGDHHLVENNDISHVSDGITNFGMYNVFRNNVMHDTYTSECGSNSGNCHIDFIESEPVADGSDRPSAYNLYEAARRHGVRRIVFASSNHVTGFYRQDEVIDPTVPPRPDGYYGLSKAYGELMGRMYWYKHGVENVNVRIGSCFPEPVDARMLSTWLAPLQAPNRWKRRLSIARKAYCGKTTFASTSSAAPFCRRNRSSTTSNSAVSPLTIFPLSPVSAERPALRWGRNLPQNLGSRCCRSAAYRLTFSPLL